MNYQYTPEEAHQMESALAERWNKPAKVVYRRITLTEEIRKRREKILSHLSDVPKGKQAILAEMPYLADTVFWYDMRHLMSEGLVERIGTNVATKYIRKEGTT